MAAFHQLAVVRYLHLTWNCQPAPFQPKSPTTSQNYWQKNCCYATTMTLMSLQKMVKDNLRHSPHLAHPEQ